MQHKRSILNKRKEFNPMKRNFLTLHGIVYHKPETEQGKKTKTRILKRKIFARKEGTDSKWLLHAHTLVKYAISLYISLVKSEV